MRFTDLFIHRPVLASVVSLMIFVLGLRSVEVLQLRQYPATKDTVVTVTTVYPGASSELVQGFVTTPLQQAISEADGIDYISAVSSEGVSRIEAHMRLNYDPNAAVSQIQAKVASKRNELPDEVKDPTIDSITGDPTALMYLAFYSDTMTPSQITDYVLRVVKPQLQAIPGLAKAGLLGEQSFAMRVWLDPQRMAALGVTGADVRRVIEANNYLAGIGEAKGYLVAIKLRATTDAATLDEFRRLVVRSDGDTLVRMEDIARVELGAESYETSNWFNGKPAVFMGIEQTPGANPLEVADAVHELLPVIQSQMPATLHAFIGYDGSEFIRDSIREVVSTLGEAVLIVLTVILLALGSLRAALIPTVTVPLSLVGAAFLMLLAGFSLNLLTLLAMVLAIGLVVDDAIVVVENIHRHIEMGKPRLRAAIDGARELGLPILAMTTTLVAVYLPIGFMEGLVGALFTEFAFALAEAVLISGVVAITLAPMLCSRVLEEKGDENRFELMVEHFFQWLAERYRRTLHGALGALPVTLVIGVVVLASIGFMYQTSRKELAPTEDYSLVLVQAKAPQTASLEYEAHFIQQIERIFEAQPEFDHSFIFAGFGGQRDTVLAGFKLPTPEHRTPDMRSQFELLPFFQNALHRIAGFDIAVFPRPSLPGAGRGLPVQFVVTSDGGYRELAQVSDELIGEAMASGRFFFLRKAVNLDLPRTVVHIDRDRAGDLGLTMQDIGRNLSTLLGGNDVNRFSLAGRSYKVIPQVERAFRLHPEMLEDYYLRAANGGLLPLSSVVRFEQVVEPSRRTQHQQLNSITVEGVMRPGVSMGDAIETLEAAARKVFPKGFGFDYTGPSRQYAQQGSALMLTFFMSLLVIYLVLAAQFESWRDPVIILVSVPMSIAGGMLAINLGFASLNIYTQIGLITLIGLIAKNGILIVQFANHLQIEQGLDKRAAVEKAASIRLRPILMTTAAMVMATIPLILATGTGAVSRAQLGLVIASGLGIGTLFTLFMVPAVYLLLARRHTAAEALGEAAPADG